MPQPSLVPLPDLHWLMSQEQQLPLTLRQGVWNLHWPGLARCLQWARHKVEQPEVLPMLQAWPHPLRLGTAVAPLCWSLVANFEVVQGASVETATGMMKGTSS